MANTFYKPKNEYGELLASCEYVNIEIADNINNLRNELSSDIVDTNKQIGILEAKHEDDIFNLSKDFENKNTEITESIIELGNKQCFTFTPIFQPIDEYIASLHSQDNFDPAAFKIKIGQTIYLRETGAGETGEYEEYICTNPNVYDTALQDYKVLTFNRLGAVEAIVASKSRHGSVLLEDSIYNTPNWDIFRRKKEGSSPVEYVPIEGLAVAPYALKDFKDTDNALKNKDIELEGAIAETNLKVGEIDGRIADNEAKIKSIIDELGGIIEDNKAEITDSRMDKNEADISANKELIDELRKVVGLGPHDCNSSSASCNCGHECKFDTKEDCCLICKVNNLDDAVNTNADSLVNLSGAFDEAVGRLQEKDIELDSKISNINITVGNPDNNSDAQTLFGRIKKNRELIDAASNNILSNTTNIGNWDIDKGTISSVIAETIESIETNTNTIGQWDTVNNGTIANAVKTVQELSEDNKDNITANKASIDELSSKVESLGTNPNPTGEVVTAWGEITRLKTYSTKNASDIEEIQNIIGSDGDTTTSTIWGKIGSLSDEIEETIDRNIGELTTRTENIENDVNKLKSEVTIIYSYPRNIILGVVIPSAGELELTYPEIFKAAFGEDAGTYPTHEVIINSIKLKDDNNDYYEQAMPEIQYKGAPDASGDNDSRYIHIKFIDNDDRGHEAIISLTVYDNNSTTSKFLIYK